MTAIPAFLDDLGFALEETLGALELMARILESDARMRNYGEFLATARRRSCSGR